jgi:hypothetical protein
MSRGVRGLRMELLVELLGQIIFAIGDIVLEFMKNNLLKIMIMALLVLALLSLLWVSQH